jgi:Peptidase family M28
MFRDLLALIEPEISAQRAWDDAIAVHSIDRRFTFADFHASARYSAERMRAAGMTEVAVLEAPADGESVFGDWRMPMAWEVEAATFDLLYQSGGSQRIADRQQVPTCLAMWSAPTPPEGIEAEIVLVEDPFDLARDVRGKIAFIGVHPHQAKLALANAGAVGILTDYLHGGANLPDAVAWINSFSDDRGGWAYHADNTPMWSFQISPREGERIRARLRAGETLRGRAVVRSRLEAGTLPAITGLVPGTGTEEVVLIGHQFEQGAIDNASGIGCMLEAARALQALIARGALPRPQRSIRLLFVSECFSNLYFWEKTKRHRRTVAGLCLDSPVGDLNYAVRPMEIHVEPHAMASYVDALMLHLAAQAMAKAPLEPWREAPFGMTDNLIADPSIGIACPWIGQHSRTWHTSADTPDRLPVAPMGLTSLMTAAYAYLIASADAARAVDFAHLAAARGRAQLAAAGVAEVSRLGQTSLDDGMNQIHYVTDRQVEAVGAVARLAEKEARRELGVTVRALQRDLRRAGRDEAAALARRAGRPGHTPQPHVPEHTLDTIHPRRLVLGPLAFDRLPLAERIRRANPRWSEAAFSVLSWCNGRRSLDEACYLAAREVRRDRAVSPDELAKQIDPAAPSMLDYFEFLRTHGYVTW